jgi:hypothetical protein
VRFKRVGPAMLAISSIKELLATVLDRLDACVSLRLLLLLSDLPGELYHGPITC